MGAALGLRPACAESCGAGRTAAFPPEERREAARGAAEPAGAGAERGLRRRPKDCPGTAGGASRAAPAGVLKATAAAFALARRQN